VTRAHRVVHLDEIEVVPGPGSLRWIPVRAALGLRAFGTNAYVGEPGDDVVEPHTEDPEAAHEEMYFVARGRATFTIDGETFDAPSGTYVFVPDPNSHRHAVAAEAGTAVLSFGGPPAFEPSAWEWAFRAAPLISSDPQKARMILEDGLRAHPESPGIRLRLAELALAEDDPETARRHVIQARKSHLDVASWVLETEVFPRLREDPKTRALLEAE
jgi:mannose-6-phosphate isomerase-like protein (cupin superfamily)